MYVPDNPLSHVLAELAGRYSDVRLMLATREEEAFGIAAGLYLGGRRPTVMLQSSGLGNSLNAIGIAGDSVSDPDADRRQHAGRCRRMEFRAGADGQGGAADLRRVRRSRTWSSIAAEHAADIVRLTATTAFATRQAGACVLPRRVTTA